jgi:hypothetical protein
LKTKDAEAAADAGQRLGRAQHHAPSSTTQGPAMTNNDRRLRRRGSYNRADLDAAGQSAPTFRQALVIVRRGAARFAQLRAPLHEAANRGAGVGPALELGWNCTGGKKGCAVSTISTSLPSGELPETMPGLSEALDVLGVHPSGTGAAPHFARTGAGQRARAARTDSAQAHRTAPHDAFLIGHQIDDQFVQSGSNSELCASASRRLHARTR